MQIIEVKNNLVRISYNSNQDSLVLSGFVIVKDQNLSYIAQIMHLEANARGSFAILKLILTFDDNGILNGYNGSIPNAECELSTVDTQELLSLLPAENPIFIGQLAQQDVFLNLDIKLFEEKLLVACENLENSKLLTENIATQLLSQSKKVLIIDLEGEFVPNKITAGKEFKLPLNYETINFIYEKGIDDASPESKALIQEIFLEVQNYVKTIPDNFIPFDSFKTVVDEQYSTLGLVELVLLKNKLLKFNEAGIFAQSKNDFAVLENSLGKNALTTLDLSQMEPKIQREMISYVYSLLAKTEQEIYVLLKLNDSNSDKKLLKQIFTTKNAYSTINCAYSYKYLTELKQISKNLIMFAPIHQQQDFASYSAFLNKLNQDEFIVHGKSTHHMPLIVKLDDKPQQAVQAKPAQIKEEILPEYPISETQDEIVEETLAQDNDIEFKEEDIEEQIMQDVETLYTAPPADELSESDLTEDDLDFIEELNSNTDFGDDLFGEENVQPEEITISEDIYIDENEESVQPIENQQLEQKQILPEIIEIQEEPISDILPASAASSIPIYSAEINAPEGFEPSQFEQGDTVMHVKYGKGVVEKMITYGAKTLCSIQFDNVGRRLLDPTLAEIKKV